MNKLINTLLLVSSAALVTSGIIFLCLSIFTEPKNNTYLIVALGSIVISNLFNVISMYYNRKSK